MSELKYSNIVLEFSKEELERMKEIDKLKNNSATSISHCQYGSTHRRYGGAFTV